ncbi:MAG: Imm1 family immunity protein [Pseudonocardiaceae bacterium]
MTTTELTSLAARDEIEIATIRRPGDLTTALTTANDQRGSFSGRVWFLITEPDIEAPCLAVGVRGTVGALEWIDDERLVPVDGLNSGWATYYTVHLHDNSMPPHAELPLATVLAAAEEYIRTGRRPTCIDWMPATA